MDLVQVMDSEYDVLKLLYDSLGKQNEYLIKREAFSLDEIVKVIDARTREVAKWEVARRKITGNTPMRSIVQKSEDEYTKKLYEDIVELIEKIQFQKETNEALVKQWLVFTTQMLAAIKPNRTASTYNAMGKNR